MARGHRPWDRAAARGTSRRILLAAALVVTCLVVTPDTAPAQDTCADDAFEPNQGYSNGPELNPEVAIAAQLCPDDLDYFRVLADEGDTITAIMYIVEPDTELIMWLRDTRICFGCGPGSWTPRAPLATSIRTEQWVSLTYTVPPGEGRHYAIGVGAATEYGFWTIPEHDVETSYGLIVFV